MRYIGNKQKLLPFIGAALDGLGLHGGTACDPFAGTAAVSRFLKERGFTVLCGDLMEYSYVLQRALVEVDAPPRFAGLPEIVAHARAPLDAVLRHLNGLPGRDGPVTGHFTPSGRARRMYFTAANGARIDAVRETILAWSRGGRITDDERFVLVAALLEAADRVANTTGVYAAFVKSWQPNARRPLRLVPPPLVTGTGRPGRANRADALDVVANAGELDLLYLDPPYNTRQYVGYYHVPELLAENGPFPPLRGKTGLIPADGKRSLWCRRGRCEAELETLVGVARCRHILLSYNHEGIIPEATIERIFRAHGRPGTYRVLRRPYKRYRSDQDGQNRTYRGNVVMEGLYYVEKAAGVVPAAPRAGECALAISTGG